MYEWHGWETIRSRHDFDDSNDDPTPATVEAVRSLLPSGITTNEVADLRWADGDLHLWLAGSHNHAASSVVELFAATAAAAPGSYGLLHVRDDEDRSAPNSWVCHVIRRGHVTAERDEHLSPHIGLVEDVCD